MDLNRIPVILFAALVTMVVFSTDFLTGVAVALSLNYLYNLVVNSNDIFAFREFALFLFSLNYLLSFAIVYIVSGSESVFRGITAETYFFLAIPAVLLFNAGMYIIPTKIFKSDLNQIRLNAYMNEPVLMVWLAVGSTLKILGGLFPPEVAFVLYLLSSIRYIAAFSLFAINPKKFWWSILIVLSLEVVSALRGAMFHDLIMWMAFFGIFLIRLYKPGVALKSGAFFVAIIALIILQMVKADYRNNLWNQGGKGDIETFSKIAESNSTLDKTSGLSFLSRVNQGWIFASTVNNMDRTQNFAGFELIGLYTEAAVMPRFLAPNKLNAGSIEVFNKYSGFKILGGTSMALGILADGYVSFGAWGVYIFAFAFGLIYALIFKIVENWTNVSPFFLLFILPILHYAVRPDCETQTLLGQVVKGLFLFGILVWYYKGYFKKRILIRKEKEEFNMIAEAPLN